MAAIAAQDGGIIRWACGRGANSLSFRRYGSCRGSVVFPVPGPLAGVADGYANELARLGYAPASVRLQLKLFADLSEWLPKQGVAAANLTSSDLTRFLDDRRSAGHSRYASSKAVGPILIIGSVWGRPKQIDDEAPGQVEEMLGRFWRYLTIERALAPLTVPSRVWWWNLVGVVSGYRNPMISVLTRRTGDHAMNRIARRMRPRPPQVCFSTIGLTRLKTAFVTRVRTSSKLCWREELAQTLARPRYARRQTEETEPAAVVGVRHGHRERTLTGTFGKTRIAVCAPG